MLSTYLFKKGDIAIADINISQYSASDNLPNRDDTRSINGEGVFLFDCDRDVIIGVENIVEGKQGRSEEP